MFHFWIEMLADENLYLECEKLARDSKVLHQVQAKLLREKYLQTIQFQRSQLARGENSPQGFANIQGPYSNIKLYDRILKEIFEIHVPENAQEVLELQNEIFASRSI